jgi:hypothetical protein
VCFAFSGGGFALQIGPGPDTESCELREDITALTEVHRFRLFAPAGCATQPSIHSVHLSFDCWKWSARVRETTWASTRVTETPPRHFV